MAGFQIENGACTGRGFSGVDANGFCAKFYTWVTKSYAAGGPAWYIHDDYSNLTSKTFAPSDVDIGTNRITISAHGFPNVHRVRFTTTGTLPGNLSAGTTYYVIRVVDENTIQLAQYESTAIARTPSIDITSQGTGTHTIEPYEFYIIVTDTLSPSVNDYNTSPSGGAPKFLKVGYFSELAGHVVVKAMAWWDVPTKFPRGFWAGYYITTYDAADFAYSFRGGAEQMLIMARTGTNWDYFMIDDFVGDTNFLEDDTHVGVVQSGLTAGSSVVIQLDTGEAANFTLNQYYYIYDFNGHTWVNYAKCTDVNLVADQITVNTLTLNFPTGSVIASYPIRQYVRANHPGASGDYNTNWNNDGGSYSYLRTIPFVSAADGYQFHNQISGPISGTFYPGVLTFNLDALNPDDHNIYACMYPIIREYHRHNSSNPALTTGCNRAYGVCKNMLITRKNTLAQMLDYKTLDGVNWLFFCTPDPGGEALGSSYAYMCRDTSSLT
jgi:hypothetical protein